MKLKVELCYYFDEIWSALVFEFSQELLNTILTIIEPVILK